MVATAIPGTFVRYGCEWDVGETDLTIELACFREGITPEEGGLGKAGHARNAIDLLFNREDSIKRFTWHPWAEIMLDRACQHKYLSVAGCASSGKTDFFAVYSILCFLSDPANTKVLVTSTSLKDSRRRIWGSITEYWAAMPEELQKIAKLVASIGIIKYRLPNGDYTERAGIDLLAGDPSKEKESVAKMIGFKRGRVIVIADELPDLSESILQAALGNLNSNPEFQLIGIGNPASHYDAFGVFSKPVNGWRSISPLDMEWETVYGWCVRFDGMKSPNVVANEVIYPWMLTREKIMEGKKNLGENSPQFWRMYRGFWCPAGAEEAVYSESDITMHGAEETVHWAYPPLRLGALDASFSVEGDRAPAVFASLGESIHGQTVLQFDPEYHEIREDITNTTIPRNYQIANAFRDLCVKNKVLPTNAAIDSTGAGGPFADILSVVWSPEVLRVYFGGAPSDRPVSSSDSRPGTEAYSNRVTELWFAGKELLRTGQLKGLPAKACKEMCLRLYRTLKRSDSTMVEVEPKKEMKIRVGFSPDVADAVFILLDLARDRHGFSSNEKTAVQKNRTGDTWEKFVERTDVTAKAGRTLRRASGGGDDIHSLRSSGFINLRRLR